VNDTRAIADACISIVFCTGLTVVCVTALWTRYRAKGMKALGLSERQQQEQRDQLRAVLHELQEGRRALTAESERLHARLSEVERLLRDVD